MEKSNGIVADGYYRAYRALEPEIRAKVTAEYSERLEKADVQERRLLKRQIEAEIRRRIHERAPPDALY
jgi:hypothetical protein